MTKFYTIPKGHIKHPIMSILFPFKNLTLWHQDGDLYIKCRKDLKPIDLHQAPNGSFTVKYKNVWN